MARIEIPKFDEVKAGFEPIPEGTYLAQIVEGKVETSKEGNAMINWRFDICEGDATGKPLWDYTSLQPAALWKVKSLIETAGIPFDPKGFSTEDALGKRLRLKVTLEEYEGKQRNKIDAYLPE